MASAFPGGIDSVPDITNPTATDTNVAPTLSTRLNLATDAMTAIETWLLANVSVWTPPSGMITEFAGSTVPTGWLLCNGQAVSRTTFAVLFSVCGTAYGIGDGSTTFNVPDLRGRSSMGAGTGTGLSARTLGQQLGEQTHIMVTAELSAHNHTINDPGHAHGLNDPGHVHGINDPGHAHGYTNAVASAPGTSVQGGNTFQASAAGTNISGTGISIALNGTNASVAANGTGVTTVNTGSGVGHNTIHPVTVVNFIVKT